MADATPGRPVLPASLSHDPGRWTRRPPAELPLNSYRTQRYQLRLDGARYELAPGTGPRTTPLDLPLHLISGWHPQGAPSTRGEGHAAQGRLLDRLDERAVVATVTAYPSNRSWFEPALAITGLSDDAAVHLAWEVGQLAAVRWDKDAITVLPTDLSVPRQPASGWQWRQQTGPRCPLLGRVEQCRLHGGPFGSAAIHAAAISRAHRDLAAVLLGCDICTGRGPGGVSLAPITLGSRHGGYAWRPDPGHRDRITAG